MAHQRTWRSFTLRDLLVVTMLCALGSAYLLPWIVKVRERSLADGCADNMRAIGVGMHVYAERSPRTNLCSGASDYRFDGCPDEIGWVADQLRLGGNAIAPQRLVCPANPARSSATLNDMLAGTDALACGACGGIDDGIAPVAFEGTAVNSPSRAAQVARKFVNRGYHTNYAASWPLARTGPKLQYNSAWKEARFVPRGDLRHMHNGRGVLSLRNVEASVAPSRTVPLLGDGAVSPTPLSQTLAFAPRLPDGTVDPHAGSDQRSAVLLRSGTPLAATLNPGPARWNPDTSRIEPLSERDNMSAELQALMHDFDPGAPRAFLQDTRGWQAAHTSGGKSCLQLLMADGSVQSLTDDDGDGMLNPGFGTTGRLSSMELPPGKVYSGVILPYRPRLGCLKGA